MSAEFRAECIDSLLWATQTGLVMLTIRITFSLILVSCVLVPRSQGQMICSKSTVEGPYGFISSVQIPFSKDGTHARHFIGVVVYDGHGKAKVDGITLGADGHEETVTATGLYELDSHCIGRVTLRDQSNVVADWRFVVVSGTSELLTISEQSIETAPFLQKKQ